MSYRSRGFVLLLSLMMIFVISILACTCLQQVLLLQKTANSFEEHHHRFHQMERIAHNLIRLDVRNQDKNCFLNTNNPVHALLVLKQKQGCFTSNQKYQYVLEDLGEYPCLKIGRRSSHHYRVTLMSYHSVLQIRYLKPIENIYCAQTQHQVTAGISSWRYLEE